jgi:hypothetical protein
MASIPLGIPAGDELADSPLNPFCVKVFISLQQEIPAGTFCVEVFISVQPDVSFLHSTV